MKFLNLTSIRNVSKETMQEFDHVVIGETIINADYITAIKPGDFYSVIDVNILCNSKVAPHKVGERSSFIYMNDNRLSPINVAEPVDYIWSLLNDQEETKDVT